MMLSVESQRKEMREIVGRFDDIKMIDRKIDSHNGVVKSFFVSINNRRCPRLNSKTLSGNMKGKSEIKQATSSN